MSIQRQPHAVLDLPSPYQKALKIERLLDLAILSQPIQMLEIGTGSGGIAHYLPPIRHLRFRGPPLVSGISTLLQGDFYSFVSFTLGKDVRDARA